MTQDFDQSSFKEMIESGRFDWVLLSTNYRSHWAIAGLVSRLFYGGRLGAFRVREPLEEDTLKLIDTRGIDHRQEHSAGNESLENNLEAECVVQELDRLIRKEKFRAKDIGIITPYKSQVDLIRQKVTAHFGRDVCDLLEVATVDSFQGSEKPAILVSFVRSNPARQGGTHEVGFLDKLERLDVALSRAQDRLILIGDFDTLQNADDPRTSDIFREIQAYHKDLLRMLKEPEPVVEAAGEETAIIRSVPSPKTGPPSASTRGPEDIRGDIGEYFLGERWLEQMEGAADYGGFLGILFQLIEQKEALPVLQTMGLDPDHFSNGAFLIFRAYQRIKTAAPGKPPSVEAIAGSLGRDLKKDGVLDEIRGVVKNLNGIFKGGFSLEDDELMKGKSGDKATGESG